MVHPAGWPAIGLKPKEPQGSAAHRKPNPLHPLVLMALAGPAQHIAWRQPRTGICLDPGNKGAAHTIPQRMEINPTLSLAQPEWTDEPSFEGLIGDRRPARQDKARLCFGAENQYKNRHSDAPRHLSLCGITPISHPSIPVRDSVWFPLDVPCFRPLPGVRDTETSAWEAR